MSQIVAARFDTFEHAESVAQRLHADGFAPDHTSVFFVTQPGSHDEYPIGGDRASDPAASKSPYGAVAGVVCIGFIGLLIGVGIRAAFGTGFWVLFLTTGLGAYVGSLLGALIATRRHRPPRMPGVATGRRHAGVLLAVKVDESNATRAAQALSAAGGCDIEEAEGTWRDGQWVDFDPVHSPVLTTRLSAAAQ